jgi:hypothetical protein
MSCAKAPSVSQFSAGGAGGGGGADADDATTLSSGREDGASDCVALAARPPAARPRHAAWLPEPP